MPKNEKIVATDNVSENSVIDRLGNALAINLDDYYSGLIHISEISHGFVKDINNYVKLGDTIRVRVVDVDDELCHVKLSIKDVDYQKVD